MRRRSDTPLKWDWADTATTREVEKAPHLDAGRRRTTQRALWTIQRAGCIDSTSLDGDVNYLTSRKPERMAGTADRAKETYEARRSAVLSR
jgi:hypothetical protein